MNTSTQLSRCCWVRKTNLRPTEQKNFTWGGEGGSWISWIIHKVLRLKCCKKRRAQQLTEAHSMHVLFSVCSLRDDNVITSKTETCSLYSRVFWIFLPNIIKNDPYNFRLYRFKVGSILRHIWQQWVSKLLTISGWLTTLLQRFDTVGWVIRPVKTLGRITYIVLAQT